MRAEPSRDRGEAQPAPRPRRVRRLLKLTFGLILAYLLVAYLILPQVWRVAMRHAPPDLTAFPRITHAADGIPGDPLNIGLVGSESDVIHAMTGAKWDPADPITLRSSLRIAVDSTFRRPDDDAPVSNLYLFGRKQDLAFEQPVGDSPRQRHHVRLWRSDKQVEERPLWVGSATFDKSVGVSHRTGEVTHHIGPDVDAERDRIASELRSSGAEREVYWVDHFQQPEGRNGGGDRWFSDGRAAVVVLRVYAVATPDGP